MTSPIFLPVAGFPWTRSHGLLDFWYFFYNKSKKASLQGEVLEQNRYRKHFSRDSIFLRINLLQKFLSCKLAKKSGQI
jgi:hypothetical protein